jgi:hypothetical protein
MAPLTARFTTYLQPEEGSAFTHEAAESLVDQHPKVGNAEATVVATRLHDNGSIELTLEVPMYAVPAEVFPDHINLSIGFGEEPPPATPGPDTLDVRHEDYGYA